jgi:hypothetical protein
VVRFSRWLYTVLKPCYTENIVRPCLMTVQKGVLDSLTYLRGSRRFFNAAAMDK